MRHSDDPPLLGVCAYASGTGKTTLLEALLPILAGYGLKVSVIKQVRADFDVDQPGKDSHRLRTAGAGQILLSSARRWVLMTELAEADPAEEYPDLQELARQLQAGNPDLILVEGYKTAPIPKIEVFRAERGKPALLPADRHIIAVASDIGMVAPVPVLDLNRPRQVADFVHAWWASQRVASIKAASA